MLWESCKLKEYIQLSCLNVPIDFLLEINVFINDQKQCKLRSHGYNYQRLINRITLEYGHKRHKIFWIAWINKLHKRGFHNPLH